MSIDRQDLIDFGRMGIQQFEKKNAELLSCFDVNKLRQQMATFSELETKVNPVRDALQEPDFNELPEGGTGGQFDVVCRALEHSFNVIFLMLFDRQALRLVVDEVTEEADNQVERMRNAVAQYEAEKRARQQQAAEVEAELAAIPVPVDPIDQVVHDWHNLGSTAFKAKWIDHSGNK
jgi:hypothetical protein